MKRRLLLVFAALAATLTVAAPRWTNASANGSSSLLTAAGAAAPRWRRTWRKWIDFDSCVTGEPTRLHGLWAAADNRPDAGPVLLYLHGAR